MEKLFTVHIQKWLGDEWFYLTDNATGKKVKPYGKEVVPALLALDRNPPEDLFDYVVEIQDEPDPRPRFVSRYEMYLDKFLFCETLKCRPILTQDGVMRRALEQAGGGYRRHITPFGRIYL